jgi:membrane protease subunit HflK
MNQDQTSIAEELKSSARQARCFLKWVALALVVFYLGTGFYTIRSNELGVLEVMGKVVDRQVLPGLHYTYPRPFSRIYKVPVRKSTSLVVDDFFQDPSPDSRASVFYGLTGLESYALSGDNNTVEVKVVLHYRSTDPFASLFGVAQKETLLRDIVCREIIHLLAVRPVDLVLTRGREVIGQALHSGIQERCDRNRTGITVDRVDIQEIRPPTVVQSFFDDVINAQIDKKQMESRAESYATAEIARARAEGDRLVREASTYRNRAIEAATGESERYLKLLEEYRKVPEITRKRLYLEFARESLSQLKNVYLVDRQDGPGPARLRVLP